ncbi:MAG: hypothetical protein ONB48_12775 [candidate division KSB1 bacterium]|nr:hypothetical protein [candidate division KSB1 bacterium]MDZ7275031.1 hypothetical protein [candidate division KSB1 bacterium]MDZ7286520.1 hypothetical protein [candidate division KSB1 bacterium]MDZ7299316.1 hypothetical protein [candidate division KSB1 bacterium]MDZ7306987.1 hypothetical protein [candidate division KSB1 bacterium]
MTEALRRDAGRLPVARDPRRFEHPFVWLTERDEHKPDHLAVRLAPHCSLSVKITLAAGSSLTDDVLSFCRARAKAAQ